jgi:hypothetical protein
MYTTGKISYNAPQLERIIIDNEISLALESTPPMGPNETMLIKDSQTNCQNPFHDNKV